MTTIEIIAQVISIIAMTTGILSFQFKTQVKILIFQCIANIFFTFSYILLGGIMGAILSVVAIIRNAVFALRGKYKWAGSIYVALFFLLITILSYVLTITVLVDDPAILTVKYYIIEAIPIFGSGAAIFAFRMKEAKNVRKFMFFSSPLWLIYNCFYLNIGGILNEAISIISIIVGIIRLDIKKKDKERLH